MISYDVAIECLLAILYIAGVACMLSIVIDFVCDLRRASRSTRRCAIEAEALRREVLAAARYNEAQRHSDNSGQWRDWK